MLVLLYPQPPKDLAIQFLSTVADFFSNYFSKQQVLEKIISTARISGWASNSGNVILVYKSIFCSIYSPTEAFFAYYCYGWGELQWMKCGKIQTGISSSVSYQLSEGGDLCLFSKVFKKY